MPKIAGVGRPKGRKPLLNLRVPQPVFDELKALADLRGVTISEEAVRRLEMAVPNVPKSNIIRQSGPYRITFIGRAW